MYSAVTPIANVDNPPGFYTGSAACGSRNAACKLPFNFATPIAAVRGAAKAAVLPPSRLVPGATARPLTA